MDMRYMRGMDGRRLPPRNARGEFRRRRRGDRGMPMHEDMRGDMNYTGGRGGYPMRGGDYAQNQGSNNAMRGGYNSNYVSDMARRNDYGYDGHHPSAHGSTYYPIEAMGTFNGYYGMPEQDYGYDMTRGGRYGRMRDYGDYDDYGYTYGDFGENLSDEELEEWNKKLLKQLDEREKQMLSKDTIMQKARMMNKSMEGFSEKEFYTTVLMVYTDYKNSIGSSPELSIKLAHDWLSDKDAKVRGGEKLAVYYDCIVEWEDDD